MGPFAPRLRAACGRGDAVNRKQRIRELRAKLAGLANDARYHDLCRTYGDYSAEVLRHLESCATVQGRDGNHT